MVTLLMVGKLVCRPVLKSHALLALYSASAGKIFHWSLLGRQRCLIGGVALKAPK